MLPEIITEIPGPDSRRFAGRLREVESRNVTYLGENFPVFWERAEGTNVWDADGNRYLDLTSAFGVCGLGHGNAEVSAALREQAPVLMHSMGDVHPTALKVAVCEALSELTFERWSAGKEKGKTILCNSGFEAVEAALKTAHVRTGKARVISFEGAYHGLGYGALAAGGMERFRSPFARQLRDLGVVFPFPTVDDELEELEKEMVRAMEDGDAGAVLVEPILGRGGKLMPAPGLLKLLRNLCDAHGMVLIFDEIYTGFHRSGKMFACEHWEVVPDLICLGKALTSGFPMSACVGKAEVMDAWPLSTGEALHTSTFLGNPLGCRMALASMEIHRRPETAERVNSAGARLRSILERLESPHLEDETKVRGAGLMLGVPLKDHAGVSAGDLAGAVMTRALQSGLLMLCDGEDGSVLSLTPPFAISEEEIAFVARELQEYLTSLPGSIS